MLSSLISKHVCPDTSSPWVLLSIAVTLHVLGGKRATQHSVEKPEPPGSVSLCRPYAISHGT